MTEWLTLSWLQGKPNNSSSGYLWRLGLEEISIFFFKVFNSDPLFSLFSPLPLRIIAILSSETRIHTQKFFFKTFLFPHLNKQNKNKMTFSFKSNALIFFNHFLVSRRILVSHTYSWSLPFPTCFCTYMADQTPSSPKPLLSCHKFTCSRIVVKQLCPLSVVITNAFPCDWNSSTLDLSERQPGRKFYKMQVIQLDFEEKYFHLYLI